MSEFTKRVPGDVYIEDDVMTRQQLRLVLAANSLVTNSQTLTLLTAHGIITGINEKSSPRASWPWEIGADGYIRRKRQ